MFFTFASILIVIVFLMSGYVSHVDPVWNCRDCMTYDIDCVRGKIAFVIGILTSITLDYGNAMEEMHHRCSQEFTYGCIRHLRLVFE